MSHPQQDTPPMIPSQMERPRPHTHALTAVPPRDVAGTLGLHRPRGRREFRRAGIITLLVALAAVGSWLGINGRTASGPVYRTEAVQRGRYPITTSFTSEIVEHQAHV